MRARLGLSSLTVVAVLGLPAGLSGQAFQIPHNLFTITPCRVIDTRGPAGPLGAPALFGGSVRTFNIRGQCGLTASASSLVANLTVTGSQAQGEILAYPGDLPSPPLASMISYRPNQTRSANSVINLDGSGNIKVRANQTPGTTTHFILDVTGFFGGPTEIDGGQAIIGTGHPDTSFFAPSAQVTLDLSSYLVYVQAERTFTDQLFDEVLVYSRPNTWNGLTTPFPAMSPTAVIFAESGNHYGHPSAFIDNGKYFLTVVKTPTDTAFKEQLIGTSANGLTGWSWFTLFRTGSNFDIPAVTLKYARINNQDYWWGFTWLQVRDGSGNVTIQGLGAIRVHLASRSIQGIDRIEMLSGGVWVSFNRGAPINFLPDLISLAGTSPKLHSVGSAWELWVDACFKKNGCGCNQADEPGDYVCGSGYKVVRVDTNYSFGPIETATSRIRCLPASYHAGRAFPEPIEGTDLLYTMSNDINCSGGARNTCVFCGAYVVVTRLQRAQ